MNPTQSVQSLDDRIQAGILAALPAMIAALGKTPTATAKAATPRLTAKDKAQVKAAEREQSKAVRTAAKQARQTGFAQNTLNYYGIDAESDSVIASSDGQIALTLMTDETYAKNPLLIAGLGFRGVFCSEERAKALYTVLHAYFKPATN